MVKYISRLLALGAVGSGAVVCKTATVRYEKQNRLYLQIV